MKKLNYEQAIEHFVTNDTFFDTNALMNPGFITLMIACAPLLKVKNKSVFVYYPVVSELRKLTTNHDSNTATSAQRALMQVEFLSNEGIITFEGSSHNKYPAKPQQLGHFVKHRNHRAMSFITCNKKMAKDVLMINQLQSFQGFPINAFSISNEGYLEEYEEEVEADRLLGMFSWN